MKFNILFLLLIGCMSSNAQFNKGDKYIGGSLNASFNSNSPSSGAGTGGTYGSTSETNSYLGLSPTVGFFLNSKTAYGFSLGYSYTKYYAEYPTGTGEDITKSLNASIFLKQFFPISDNFYFTLAERLIFSRGTQSTIQTSLNYTNENPTYTVGLGVGPSFIFFPSPRWGLEAGFGNLSYNYTRKLPNDGDVNSLSLSLTSYVSFGFNYYFRKSD